MAPSNGGSLYQIWTLELIQALIGFKIRREYQSQIDTQGKYQCQIDTQGKYQCQIDTQGIFYKPHNHVTCVPTIFASRKSLDSSQSRTCLRSGHATDKPPGSTFLNF
ncbi:hypothetical protein TNCV_1254581 [Trichonephila clavipes]|nr:hypothetical protein TNCV_1254581 [Trichonephila clavipes]